MTQAAKHTPGPWKVFTSPDGLKLVGIGSTEGEGICDAGFGVWRWNDAEGVANAELIVRAVNSHADMLAALDIAADHIKDLDGGDPTTETGWKSDELLGVWLKARAAIAKAEAA